MYSDDVLKAKASPKVKMSKPSRTREEERSRRKARQSKRMTGKNGGSPMTVGVVSAIQAAEQEAAEIEAMQKRERLLIRAMVGGFLLLVLGLAHQHNPDDHGFEVELDNGSLRGSYNPSLEWEGDRPNIAQHLTMESEDDVQTKSSSASPEEETKYGQYLDMADLDGNVDTLSGFSQDSEMESLDQLNEVSESSSTGNEISTESEDSTMEFKDEEEEQISLGEEEHPVDQLDGRLETAEVP